MNRHVALTLGVFLSFVFAGGLLAEKGGSLAGTWKLNVEKSKYSTGAVPKSATCTIEAQGEGERTSCEEVAADGGQVSFAYSATYDDKDHPLTTTGADIFSGADSIAMRRTGSNSYGAALKKSGQVVMTMRAVVSKNGQTLMITANGADAKGQPTSQMSVWEKQEAGAQQSKNIGSTK